jgi:hypothetical protein
MWLILAGLQHVGFLTPKKDMSRLVPDTRHPSQQPDTNNAA